MEDSSGMKLIRIQFQIAVLLTLLVAFSHPLFADTGDATPADNPSAQSAPATQSTTAHLSTSTTLAEIESGFIEVIVPMLTILIAGPIVWRLIPPPRREKAAVDEPPVEIPPLRSSPYRVTKF
jgi:hypothetical protein